MQKIDARLHEQLENIISSMGYEFVGCEMATQGQQKVFRVYIDNTKKGVTVDDCSKVSGQISAMLDVEDIFQARYSLEVSSPGIDRPLFVIEHYRKHVGSQVKVKLYSPINKRKQLRGTIVRVDGDDIYLMLDGDVSELKLPFSLIEKANLIGDVHL